MEDDDDNRLYRTVVKVEVLSRGPLAFFEDLADLHHMITYGHFSGEYETESSKVVSKARMRQLLERQRSNPDFFDELDDEADDNVVEWDDVDHSHEHEGVKVHICWVFVGEGVDGAYDPDDPEDEPRLRADIVVTRDGLESEEMSYCTLAPVGTPLRELEDMLFDLSNAVRADFPNFKTVVELWTHRTRPKNLGDL